VMFFFFVVGVEIALEHVPLVVGSIWYGVKV
jgi:hypothetical protein